MPNRVSDDGPGSVGVGTVGVGVHAWAPGDGQAFQVFGHQTFIPLTELIRYGDEFDRGSVARLGLGGDVPDRLVQNNRNKFLLFFDGLGRERDFSVRRDLGAELINYNAVNRNHALLNEDVRFAARTDAALSHQL